MTTQEAIKVLRDYQEYLVSLTKDKLFMDKRGVPEAIDTLISELEKQLQYPSEEEYEPYFGWCEVDGCHNEGCGGGMWWRDTGYWTLCHEHAESYRNGDPQPKMKQTAIDREAHRDPITGWCTGFKTTEK